MRIAVLIIAAAGCQSYQAGSFSHVSDTRAPRATTGCLDIAVERRSDAAATGEVARIALGNRCDHAVEVDLGAIRARGQTADGASIAYAAFDPRGEIRPAVLDGRSVAAEVIEYRPVAGGPAPSALCLDLSAVTRSPGPGETLCLDLSVMTPEANPAVAGVDR